MGAHIGNDVLHYARKVGKTGLIVAVEPMCKNYVKLLRTIHMNRLNNVFPVMKAVSDRSQVGYIYVGTSSINHSMIKNRGRGQSPVSCISWDDLVKMTDVNIVTLAVVDIEGAEEGLLRGMTKVLPKYIILEHHKSIGIPNESTLDLLSLKGYEVLVEGSYVYAQRKS